MSRYPLRWNLDVDPARWDEVRQAWLAFLATVETEPTS